MKREKVFRIFDENTWNSFFSWIVSPWEMETEKWSVLKNIWNLIARRFDRAMSANISTNVNQIRELRKCARARFPDFPKEFRRGGETGVINCQVF